MDMLSAFLPRRGWTKLALATLVFLMTGCVTLPGRQEKAPSAARYSDLENQNRQLKKALAESRAQLREVKDKLAKMQLGLLEKEEQIKELEGRLKAQQKVLDEAIAEVVRAKAKLHSLESKAEAASNMAEAEIAVKALKAELGAKGPDPDLLKAEQLLKMSARAFEQENYGGTLYLTSQAKGHIKTARMRLRSHDETPSVRGEVLFAQPLPLRVLKKSNLRMGPDRRSKVVTTLSKGEPVVGHSYKGEWVRVYTEKGTHGWIYQTLVGGR